MMVMMDMMVMIPLLHSAEPSTTISAIRFEWPRLSRLSPKSSANFKLG